MNFPSIGFDFLLNSEYLHWRQGFLKCLNLSITKSYLTYLKDLSDLNNVIKMHKLEQMKEKEGFDNVNKDKEEALLLIVAKETFILTNEKFSKFSCFKMRHLYD